jgi:hypothetical protein
MLPRIGRDTGNTAGLSLKSARFLSNRWGPPHLLLQMKTTVGKLEVSEEKREALLTRISAVESETDRNRTRLEVVGALWIETCTKIGEGVQKLEPLRQWVDSIGNLIGQAKTDETANAPRLPPAVTPKRIEPPKAPNGDLDDEIPF